jgi:hypothetical protein
MTPPQLKPAYADLLVQLIRMSLGPVQRAIQKVGVISQRRGSDTGRIRRELDVTYYRRLSVMEIHPLPTDREFPVNLTRSSPISGWPVIQDVPANERQLGSRKGNVDDPVRT